MQMDGTTVLLGRSDLSGPSLWVTKKLGSKIPLVSFWDPSSLGRYVFGSEISYNKAPPRLPGLGC